MGQFSSALLLRACACVRACVEPSLYLVLSLRADSINIFFLFISEDVGCQKAGGFCFMPLNINTALVS